METQFIIEAMHNGQRGFIREVAGQLYFTAREDEAAVYRTELDAKCAFVYVADHHQPRIVSRKCVERRYT